MLSRLLNFTVQKTYLKIPKVNLRAIDLEKSKNRPFSSMVNFNLIWGRTRRAKFYGGPKFLITLLVVARRNGNDKVNIKDFWLTFP